MYGLIKLAVLCGKGGEACCGFHGPSDRRPWAGPLSAAPRTCCGPGRALSRLGAQEGRN